MRIGLIGCGKWGQEIRRVLTDIGCHTRIYDPAHSDSLEHEDELCEWADQVVVATPPQHHAAAVMAALEWGKPFFCEKPFTLNLNDARFIKAAARSMNIPGSAGYIALHASGRPVASEKIGVHRAGTATGYHNIPALWDIGVHDIAVAVADFGSPQHVEVFRNTHDAYDLRLHFGEATADISGTRKAFTKEWSYMIDGEHWSPYESTVEPLHAEMEWWLAGGDNLSLAVRTVEVLAACG